jgi:uncharacterized protein Yka (UPF0111/DUF47 family)
MFRKFLPRDHDFFALFEKLADNAVDASALFKKVASEGRLDEAAITKMVAIEHQATRLPTP